jgi:AraC family transcriptional activator of pobA
VKQLPVYDICSLSVKETDTNEIIVDGFADYLAKHHDLHFPHRHSFYHFVLFTAGSGNHEIDFTQFAVNTRQIYFMKPGQVHSWYFDGNIDGYIVNFSTDFFQPLLLRPDYLEKFTFLNGISHNQVIDLDEQTFCLVTELLKKAKEEYEHKSIYYKDLIRALLINCFITIARLTNEPSKKPLQQNYLHLRNFQKLIEQHYKQYKLPKAYADLLYVTPNYLNALCRELMGKSAGELIRDRILLEAKRLLVNANTSISSIADELNFNDNSYFSKFFKKQTGLTPEEFRKTHAWHS